MITFILTSCEKSENAPSIEGVKISGYSWELKQAFQNKGFIVAKKEKSIKTISSDYGKKEKTEQDEVSPVERVHEENFDFEKQLEESLKDL